MSERGAKRALVGAAVLTGIVLAVPATGAGATMQNAPVPPMPSPNEVDRAMDVLGRAANNPVTGSTATGRVAGGDRPPSLEALQALRPGTLPADGAEGLRAQAVCQEGRSYGANGGLAARSFGINEMLRRYEPQLDTAFDFAGLVLPAGTGRTLLRPPVVTEAQMAFALGEGGQTARETDRVYQITRRARLSAVPPNWRSYLVRTWHAPTPPPDALRPRTDKEAVMWNRCVAEGWGDGERLAVDGFLSDLGTLERDLIGMARFHVLLRAGLVEPPRVALRHIRVQGGGSDMRLQDTTISITAQPGLNADQRRWRPTTGVGADGPIGLVGR